MSEQRTFYCDGPENPDIPGDAPQLDGCPAHVTAMVVDRAYLPGGFIEVRRHVQGASYDELHFCSWDCLLRYAAKQDPAEYIEAELEAEL